MEKSMTPAVRFSRFVQHLLTFVVHFAHGGFVMAGVMTIGLVGYQLTQFGADGLNPHAMFGYRPVTVSADPQPVTAANNVVEAAFSPADAMPSVSVNLSGNLGRVAAAIAKRHHVAPVVVDSLVKAAQQEGKANGVDPLLILAVITVESGFNPFLESGQGAQGLMQIIPKCHTDKISPEKGAAALFDPVENIRVGTLILRAFMDHADSTEAALQLYGGAANDPEMHYSVRVLQEFDRLRQVAGVSAPATRTADRKPAATPKEG
jgi:soluble lytic murein transglycosylase-like protein